MNTVTISIDRFKELEANEDKLQQVIRSCAWIELKQSWSKYDYDRAYLILKDSNATIDALQNELQELQRKYENLVNETVWQKDAIEKLRVKGEMPWYKRLLS